jgi:hypothetical protein
MTKRSKIQQERAEKQQAQQNELEQRQKANLNELRSNEERFIQDDLHVATATEFLEKNSLMDSDEIRVNGVNQQEDEDSSAL